MLLREFEEKDIETLPILLGNPKVSRYLSSRIPEPYTLEAARWWVKTGCKQGVVRAIEVEGILVGAIGAEPGEFENSRSMEMGYWLGEPYWGNGFATAALQALTELVLRTSDAVRLYGQVFGPHFASARVLQKCGYEKEAVLKKSLYKNGNIYDTHVYALFR